MLKITVIDNEADFAAAEEGWNRLLGQSSSETIFLTWEWMKAWWVSYGAGKKLWILKLERDGELVGLAPFYVAEFHRFGIVGYRGLYLLGAGSWDSDYLDLISRRGEEEAVARATLEYVFNNREQWDVLFLDEIPETSGHLSSLRKWVAARDWYWEQVQVPCAYVDLPADWETYLRSLKSRVRTKVRSLTSRLEQNFQVRFDRCEAAGELSSRLESLFSLHAQRWEREGGEGVFTAAAKRRFYNEMAALFLKKDWLRLYSVSLNGVYAAHQFCIEYGNRIFLLQEGYDPALAEHGIGNVLRAYVLRDCIERKMAVYDFLGGVTPHKLSWGAQVKTSVRGRTAPPTAKSRLFFEVPKTLEMGKAGLQAILPKSVVDWGRSLKRAAQF